MIDLDFVEIGTCNFETLIQECASDAKGISIEPISDYLNQLPDKENVKNNKEIKRICEE